MKNKKGFTLVELLAVIVILGIILAIAVPNIINLITQTKNDAYLRQNDLIIDAAGKYVLQNEKSIVWTNNTATIYLRDLQNGNLLDSPLKDPRGGNYNNTVPNGTRITVTRNNNQYTYTLIAVSGNDTIAPVITLVGSNSINVIQGDTYTDPGATATDDIDGNITSKIVVTNTVNTATLGTYTVTYNVSDNAGNSATPITRTVNVVVPDYVTAKGVNRPRLIAGMTPIKLNVNTWIDTTESDTAWYNYTTSAKQWANARTADGSMWVWIPRYAYQIGSNYHSSATGNINIKFLKNATNTASDNTTVATNPTYSGSNQTNYIVHPAFNFGGTELTGIWVAKFETSVSDINNACYTAESAANCNITSLLPKIVPNVKSWRWINVGNMFTVSRNMETNNIYGWGTTGIGLDTHLIKNSEWGAAVYLSLSSYGKNSAVWINPTTSYTTGCAGDSEATTTVSATCNYLYHSTNGMQASTTGNMYGIYDMRGGALENTAAYINNGSVNLTTYGNSIITADSKYKDVYTVTTDSDAENYNNTSLKKGDAVYETSASYTGATAWLGANSFMPNLTYPWFCRGGDYGGATATGTFYFYFGYGTPARNFGFRPVLLIDTSL